jgi:hypothetical protein
MRMKKQQLSIETTMFLVSVGVPVFGMLIMGFLAMLYVSIITR